MEIVFNIIFILFSIGLSLKNPTYFICAYLLFATKFLGFISNELLIGGVEYGSFLFNLCLLIPIFLGNNRILDNYSWTVICFVVFFSLYGIFKPVVDGNQDIISGIKAGKSFYSYTFLIYTVLYRHIISYRKIFNFVRLIALYFSILYIINYIGLSFTPQYYIKDNFIQCCYDSFLPLSMSIILYMDTIGIKNRFFIIEIGFLMLGIIIGGYFSLTITAIILLLIYCIYKCTNGGVSRTIIIGYIGLFIVILFLCISKTTWFTNIETAQTAALHSRSIYNEFRWDIIRQNFLFGHGFLYKSSPIVSSVASEGYQETFSFIDAGYIDLMGRFGLIGTILFLIYPVWISLKTIKYKTLLPFALLILMLLAVNATWSVFSFPMGIIVLSIIYPFLLLNIKVLYGRKITKLANGK